MSEAVRSSVVAGPRRGVGAERLPALTTAHLIIAATLLASASLLLVTGSPLAAVTPPAVVTGVYFLAKAPLRLSLIAFTGVWIAVDMQPRPQSTDGTIWKGPFSPVTNVLSNNLDGVLGISALRFSGSEAFFMLMLLIVGYRALIGSRTDGARRIPLPSVFVASLWVAFAVVVLLEIKGLANGGDFRQSLWQFRQLLWLPLLTLLFAGALRSPRDLVPLALAVTAATMIKIAIGLYYVRQIAIPNGLQIEFMTCHEDSMTFVTVIVLWTAVWAHRPSRGNAVAALVIGTVTLIGMGANDRRLAYVSLAANLALLLLMLRGPVRRSIIRALVWCLPIIVLYLAAGRHRHNGIFKPASLIMSVTEQSDESSQTRDIENFNLVQTLKHHMVLGSGWGHEYDEQVKADDISQVFAQYRFIAHNSILWLWGIAGVVGFTLLWSPLVIGAFLARRGYLYARRPTERTVGFVALAVIVSFVNQAWGDMGTQGQSCVVLLAWALAAAGKLAVGNGAFPSTIKFIASGTAAQPRLGAAVAS